MFNRQTTQDGNAFLPLARWEAKTHVIAAQLMGQLFGLVLRQRDLLKRNQVGIEFSQTIRQQWAAFRPARKVVKDVDSDDLDGGHIMSNSLVGK